MFKCYKCENDSNESNCYVLKSNSEYEIFCLNCAEWAIKKHLTVHELEEYKNYIDAVKEFGNRDNNSIYKTFIKSASSFSIRYDYCGCKSKKKWSLVFYESVYGGNQCTECAQRIGYSNVFNELFNVYEDNTYVDAYPESKYKDLNTYELENEINSTINQYRYHAKLFNYSTDDYVLGDVDSYENVGRLVELGIIYEKLNDHDGMVDPPFKQYMIKVND